MAMCIFGGGSSSSKAIASAPTGDYTAYVNNNPDLLAYYNQGQNMAKGRTIAEFGAYHYMLHGQSEGRVVPGSLQDIQNQQNQATKDATNTTNQLITDLTKGFQDQIDAITKQGQAQTDALNQANTNLTGQIKQQQADFAKSQADLLAGFQTAQGSAAKAMSDAIEKLVSGQSAAAAAANATGQMSKKPNYARALAENKRLNSSGLSATNLTGATGIPTASLPLSNTSLLGA